MKTATIPSPRVAPELRHAAEASCRRGSPVQLCRASLRINIDHRRARQAFIAHDLASRDEAQRAGERFTADGVLCELDEMIAEAQAKPRK